MSSKQKDVRVDDGAVATYLREHIAGSHAAEGLARGVIERSNDASTTEFLRGFVEQIRTERGQVESLLEPLEDNRGVVRKGVDVATEVAAKAGRLVNLGPPGDLAELEMLAIGVWGKRLLWGTVRALAEVDERFAAVPVDELSDHAEKQEVELLRLRQDAVLPSLTTG